MMELQLMLPTRYCRITFKYRVSGGYTGNFKFDSYDLDDSYEWTRFDAFIEVPDKYFETDVLDAFVYSLFDGEGAITDLEVHEIIKHDIEPKWYNHK